MGYTIKEIKMDIKKASEQELKARAYDSLWDTLLTYGSEETAPPASDTNVLFIFSNF